MLGVRETWNVQIILLKYLMEEIMIIIISTLLAWAVERSADAVLDLIIEWLKRR